ncbi:hypothetical protein [Hutsoniella sourekii]|uniref:hypothetical protein n=1 Tax=Hutsoniella sourekii TaxID=87650 RepID=UPI000481D66D|nr:hypothetical protein [Hutsoniella sourekii]
MAHETLAVVFMETGAKDKKGTFNVKMKDANGRELPLNTYTIPERNDVGDLTSTYFSLKYASDVETVEYSGLTPDGDLDILIYYTYKMGGKELKYQYSIYPQRDVNQMTGGYSFNETINLYEMSQISDMLSQRPYGKQVRRPVPMPMVYSYLGHLTAEEDAYENRVKLIDLVPIAGSGFGVTYNRQGEHEEIYTEAILALLCEAVTDLHERLMKAGM